MHHQTRRKILPLVLIGWTVLSAWGLSGVLRNRIENRLQDRVSEALHADPALAHVQSLFNGFDCTLSGGVGAEALRERAERVAKDTLPTGEIVGNEIKVGAKSPTVRAIINHGVVVLEGQVADRAAVEEFVTGIRDITIVDDVNVEQLLVSGEIRSITWVPNLVEFLPKFMVTCKDGVLDTTDDIWAMTGTASDAVKHNELKEAWRKALPEDAVADFDGLKLAETAPEPPATPSAPIVAVGTPNPTPPVPEPAPNPNPATAEPTTPTSSVPDPKPVPPTPPVVASTDPPTPELVPEPKPEPPAPPEPPPLPLATPEQLEELQEALADFTIFFERKSSYMGERDTVNLTKAVKLLTDFGFAYDMEVIGFADNIGDASFNRWLAGQRAERLQQFFLEHNIPVKRIRAQIVKREPGKKLTPAEAREDRRAELKLVR